MKRMLLLCVAAVLAAVPCLAESKDSKAAPVFEVRLVAPVAGLDTEDMVFTHHPSLPPRTLHVRRETLMDQTTVASVEVVRRNLMLDPYSYSLVIKLTDRGRDLLAKVTRENVGGEIAFLIDGKVVMAPAIDAPITQGEAEIAAFTKQEAETLAAKINAMVKRRVHLRRPVRDGQGPVEPGVRPDPEMAAAQRGAWTTMSPSHL